MSKSILITGCSTGIGYHCAKQLHARGYQVFASVRKEADATRLRNEGLDSFVLDVSDSDSIQKGMHYVLEQTGGTLDALFNNGAYGQPGAVEDLTREVLQKQLDTNLLGWHELTVAALKVMRQQGHGRIVHNSSVLGFVAIPFRGAYNCSKFALEGLTDTLRNELADTNIHISLIEPGPILSNFRKNALHALQENIDIEHSPHKEKYQGALKRLKKEGAAAPFTLGPEAVLKKLLHAINSPKPKVRYYVTFPTYLFAYLKRLLTHRALDWVIRKVSSSENR